MKGIEDLSTNAICRVNRIGCRDSFLMGQQVKLYVKSVRKVVGTKEEGDYTGAAVQSLSGTSVGGSGGAWRTPITVYRTYRKFEEKTAKEYVLSEEQEEVVKLLEETAPKCGFEVVVVDLGRISRFSRSFRKEFRELKVLPTLKTSSGRTLTTFTKQDVETLLLNETASARRE